jgi:uncharacterized protein (DUF433 family)
MLDRKEVMLMKPTAKQKAARQPVPESHIWLDERGRAWIDDTNIKVIEVVLDKVAYGMSPEEIHQEYPYLSLAQIHAAFTYYYDHKDHVDSEIERQVREFDEMKARAGESPFRKRMRAEGRLP